jgi:hypothetical protein
LKSRRFFKARRNVIVFRTGDLELPFATYNPELLAACRPNQIRFLSIEGELSRRGVALIEHDCMAFWAIRPRYSTFTDLLDAKKPGAKTNEPLYARAMVISDQYRLTSPETGCKR